MHVCMHESLVMKEASGPRDVSFLKKKRWETLYLDTYIPLLSILFLS